MKPRKAPLASACLILSLVAVAVTAQPVRPDIEEFGTQDGNDLWIPASQFVPVEVGPVWNEVYEGYSTSAQGFFEAFVPLPQGAYVDSWRVFYYDNSSNTNLEVYFVKQYDDITASPTHHSVLIHDFISSGTPGFTSHHQTEGLTIDLRDPYPGSGVTRNQAADFYIFQVRMPGGGIDVAFKGIRVLWHRQVSPAPATATFNDVPTSDPAFQYIEALAASGITAGCNTSPPMYCPDATLTRRQMAVFLSKALGLHWPNF